MLTATAENLVGQTIESFLTARRPFTAHEVTRQVRTQTRDNVRHADVKDIVHTAFHQGLFGEYGRVLANIAGVDPQPWVYHAPGSDLSAYGLGQVVQVIDYDDQDHDSNTPLAQIPVLPALLPAALATVAPDADNTPDTGSAADAAGVYTREVDQRESLSIPAPLVKEAGMKAGDTAWVYADPVNNRAVVRKDDQAPASLTFLMTYTVNLHTNVRVTKATLQRAGLPGKSFRIGKDADNSIEIKPV